MSMPTVDRLPEDVALFWLIGHSQAATSPLVRELAQQALAGDRLALLAYADQMEEGEYPEACAARTMATGIHPVSLIAVEHGPDGFGWGPTARRFSQTVSTIVDLHIWFAKLLDEMVFAGSCSICRAEQGYFLVDLDDGAGEVKAREVCARVWRELKRGSSA